MQTYSYIDKSGKSQQTQAANSNLAMAGAINIDPHSGVQLITRAKGLREAPIVPTPLTPSAPPIQPTQPAPTVLTDANIREKTIPDITARAATYTNTPPVVGSIQYDLANNLAPGTSSQQGYRAPNPNGDSTEDIYNKNFGEADKAPLVISPEEQTLLDIQKTALDKTSADAIAAIKAKFDVRNRLLVERNAKSTQQTQNALQLGGTSRYAPTSESSILASKERYDMQTLADLQTEEEGLISQVRAAQSEGEMQLVQKKLELLEKKRQEKIVLAGKISENLAAETKSIRERQQQEDDEYRDDTQSIVLDMAKNMAPPDIRKKVNELIKNKASYAEVVDAAGDYLQTGTGDIGSYLFYKRDAEANNIKPMSFDDWQTREQNRRVSVANTTMGDGTYTKDQLSALTRINENVSKNATYSKSVSMRTYADNVRVALSQGNGVGDIAAINQFQKVIDEGAVTRDQDVKLIQGAQSLVDSLKLKLEKLKNGQQLSQTQRDEMKTLVDSLYKSQIDALKKDPYIKAKIKEAEVSGLNVGDTVLREVMEDNSSNNSIVDEQKKAQATIDEYYTSHPEDQALIDDFENNNMDDLQIIEYLKRAKKLTFNDVGGDTNLATNKNMNRPQANNNPLNIKSSAFTQSFQGVKGVDSKPASDGGKFLTFNSPQDGFNAAKKLITSPNYKNLSIEAAMRRWSGNGYGADVAPKFKGRTINSLSPAELDELIQSMARREGFYA